MAIIEEMDESLFISRFEDYKRVVGSSDEGGGNFTYEGLRNLFKYLDNLSEETGENIKLDVISLCCDYSEYEDLNEYLNDQYEHSKREEFNTEEEFKQVIEKEISDKTTLIKFSEDLNDGFIIQNY